MSETTDKLTSAIAKLEDIKSTLSENEDYVEFPNADEKAQAILTSVEELATEVDEAVGEDEDDGE